MMQPIHLLWRAPGPSATDEPSASFGELLRDHRRAAGLTQEELAERAGVSPRSVSGLERGGAHVPRRDTVALLVRALGLAGSERDAFEGLADERRRARPPAPARDRRPAGLPAAEAERPRHNLPRALTSFVGREQELDELLSRLAAVPLLTLVGAGGVGKTRLAQELVRRRAASYPDGACFVALAGLEEPALVVGATALAVGLRDFHGRDPAETLTEYLRPKQLLLV